MPLPKTVNDHAARQRIIRLRDPLGKRSAAPAFGHVLVAEIRLQPRHPTQRAGSGGIAWRFGVAAVQHLYHRRLAGDDAVKLGRLAEVGEFLFQLRLLATEVF